MPILYEPAQPLNAAVSSAYGAGVTGSQNLAVLQRAREFPAALQAQAAAQNIAAAQHTADRDARGEQVRMGMAAQQRDQIAERDMRGEMFASQQQAQFLENQQRAELQNWLMNQEMSAKEMQRHRQLQAAVGDVMNDPNLTQRERQETILKLRTGIDVGEQRIKTAQAKHLQTQDALITAQAKKQTELEQAHRAFQAKGVQDRIEVVRDPVMQADVQQEFDAEFPDWRQKMELAKRVGNPLAQAALAASRQRAIEDELKARGGMYSRVEVAPGKYEPFHSTTEQKQLGGAAGGGAASGTPRGAGGREKPVMDAEQYGRMYNSVVKEVNADMGVPEEKKAEMVAIRMADIVKSYDEYHKKAAPPEAKRERFAGLKAQRAAASAGGGATSGTPPAEAPADAGKPFDLADPKGVTEAQQKGITGLNVIRAGIRDVPDLSPQDRAMFESQADTALKLYAQHGDRRRMPAQDGQLFDAIMASLKRISGMIPRPGQPAARVPSASPLADATDAAIAREKANPFGYPE